MPPPQRHYRSYVRRTGDQPCSHCHAPAGAQPSWGSRRAAVRPRGLAGQGRIPAGSQRLIGQFRRSEGQDARRSPAGAGRGSAAAAVRGHVRYAGSHRACIVGDRLTAIGAPIPGSGARHRTPLPPAAGPAAISLRSAFDAVSRAALPSYGIGSVARWHADSPQKSPPWRQATPGPPMNWPMNWLCSPRDAYRPTATQPRIHRPCPAAGQPRSVHDVITSRWPARCEQATP
jgi:hypothetical protein